jgi:hypothetical protein
LDNILLEEHEKDGFLIDLDMAVELDRLAASGAPARTGTKVFMASGVLDGEAHSFMHDLQSFFWVLFWIAINHHGPKTEPHCTDKSLRDWQNMEPAQLARDKDGLIDTDRFETTLNRAATQYCQPLIAPLLRLWEVIFPRGSKPRAGTEDRTLYSKVKGVLEGELKKDTKGN